MISNSASVAPVFNAQSVQTSLTADPQTTEQALAATTLISQIAIDEFALRFNAAMFEMLNAQGATSQNSPLSKRLKAYAAGRDVPLRSTLQLA